MCIRDRLLHGFLWSTEVDHPKCSAPSIQCSLHKNVIAWISVTDKFWSSKILVLLTVNALSITMLLHGFLWLTQVYDPKCSAPNIQCSLHNNVAAWIPVINTGLWPKCSASNIQCSLHHNVSSLVLVTDRDWWPPVQCSNHSMLSIRILRRGFLWLTKFDLLRSNAPNVQCSLPDNVTAWIPVIDRGWSPQVQCS